MVGAFSRPFLISSCESSTGHKAVKLNVDSSTIWLSDMRWTLTILFPVVLSLSGTSK